MEWRLRSVPIVDALGFAQPMEVARLLLPVGFTPEGGARWQQAPTPATMVQVQFRAMSADHRVGIEILPNFAWTWCDDPMSNQLAAQRAAMGQGAPVLPPMSAAEFLAKVVVPAQRPGARIVDGGSDAASSAARAQRLASGLGPVRSDVGHLVLALDVNGQPVEERLSAVVDDRMMAGLSTTAAMFGGFGAPSMMHALAAEEIWVLRYPAGTWAQHARLFATITASVRQNPHWVAAASQVLRTTQSALTAAQRRDAEIWRRHQAEVGAIHRSMWEDRQASADARAYGVGQAMSGVETWGDAAGQRVELSAGYREAWTNGQDEYIVSDDPLFDPNVHSSVAWSRLTRTP